MESRGSARLGQPTTGQNSRHGGRESRQDPVADPWRSPGAGWGPDMKSLGAIVLSFLAAAVLSLCLLGIGARTRRTARLPVGPQLNLSVDFLLGCAVLSSAFVLSGLLGGFRPVVLLLITGALAAAVRSRRAFR